MQEGDYWPEVVLWSVGHILGSNLCQERTTGTSAPLQSRKSYALVVSDLWILA
jgi:hypothetical protein